MTRMLVIKPLNEIGEEWLHQMSAATGSPVPVRAFATDNAIDVLEFAVDNLNTGHKMALCTLVEIRGGSSRPLGAHMAVADDGRYCGYVSGGCTEAAVAAEALHAISRGTDRFVMLGEGSPFFDIVLPCGGGITVAIHVVREQQPLSAVIDSVRRRCVAVLRYSPAREALSFDTSGLETGWIDDKVFATSYRPGVRLVLFGRNLEVEVTSHLARAAGYEVAHYDRLASADPALIDPDTAVVLLQHDLDAELPVLEAALAAKPFYIGALGSSRTHEKRVQQLRQNGYSQDAIARIKAPIGLFARARDAHSLALSVVADIANCRQSRAVAS